MMHLAQKSNDNIWQTQLFNTIKYTKDEGRSIWCNSLFGMIKAFWHILNRNTAVMLSYHLNWKEVLALKTPDTHISSVLTRFKKKKSHSCMFNSVGD